jgi:integrase
MTPPDLLPAPSASTLDAYRKRSRQLLARCAAETGDPEPGALAFVSWLTKLRSTLRPAAWRIYRRAASHLLEGHPDPDAAAAMAALRAVSGTEGPKPPRRTSAQRAKKVPPADLMAILGELGRSRSRHAPALRDWLVAGILVGLRPGEWAGASIVGWKLEVRTSKAADGWRGLGPTRTLDLSGLAKDDVATVRRMAERGSRWSADGMFAAKQNVCSCLLHRENLKLWPTRTRKITLYSTRHAFAANGKAGGCDPAELAAVLGHAAERSAFRSYGKRRDGWKRGRPPVPKPDAEAVAMVRRNGPVSAPAADGIRG